MHSKQPYFNYKFFSLSQLLVILEESSSNETFMENYMKIKHITLFNHDFFSLYAYMNKLKEVSS